MFSLFRGFMSSWGTEFDGQVSVTGEERFSPQNIDSIEVKWLDGELNVVYHSGDEIRLVQTSKSGSIPDDRKLVFKVTESGRLIAREGNDRFVRSHTSTSLTVYIPENGKEYSELSFSAVSGRVTTEGLLAQKFDASTVSGSLKASGFTVSGRASVSTVSGSIELSAATVSDMLDLSTTSGSMSVSDTTSDKLETSSVSGRTTVSGSFNEVKSSSVSGSIKVDSVICPSTVDMNSVSGSITLRIPDNDGFTAKYSKVSGSFSCDFAVVTEKNRSIYKDGQANFTFSSVSGSIDLEHIN